MDHVYMVHKHYGTVGIKEASGVEHSLGAALHARSLRRFGCRNMLRLVAAWLWFRLTLERPSICSYLERPRWVIFDPYAKIHGQYKFQPIVDLILSTHRVSYYAACLLWLVLQHVLPHVKNT